MRTDYYITAGKGEIDMASIKERLARMAELERTQESKEHEDKKAGRNLWTRALDAMFSFVRRHVRPLHVLGLTFTAVTFFLYARLVALTIRLGTSGEVRWPDVSAPGVVALWHGNAPSLLVAFAKRPSKATAVILVATDPRGDYLALLCRMLGFDVVRTSIHGDWHVLIELAEKLKQGALVFITADGGGPAKVAKFGALALAAATGVPLVPLAADCHPAFEQSNKWDDARNPLPFSSVTVWMGAPRTFEPFADEESMDRAKTWLEETLNKKEGSL